VILPTTAPNLLIGADVTTIRPRPTMAERIAELAEQVAELSAEVQALRTRDIAVTALLQAGRDSVTAPAPASTWPRHLHMVPA
jgi:hypothetical protein